MFSPPEKIILRYLHFLLPLSMKKTTYLDFIRNLLGDDQQFKAFEASYQQRIAKSIKILTSRIKKSDFLSFCELEGRSFTPPQFSTH